MYEKNLKGCKNCSVTYFYKFLQTYILLRYLILRYYRSILSDCKETGRYIILFLLYFRQGSYENRINCCSANDFVVSKGDSKGMGEGS